MENLQALFRCVHIPSCSVNVVFIDLLFFKMCCNFFLAAPADDTIEKTNADIPEAMGIEGEQFEVYESDSEDDKLEIVDSFV